MTLGRSAMCFVLAYALLAPLSAVAAGGGGHGGGGGGGGHGGGGGGHYAPQGGSHSGHGGSYHGGGGWHGGSWHGGHHHGSSVFIGGFWDPFYPYWYPSYGPYPYTYPYAYPYPYAYSYPYPAPYPYAAQDEPPPGWGSAPSEAPPARAEAGNDDTREQAPPPASYGLVQFRGIPDGASIDLDGRFWMTAQGLDERWVALPKGEHSLSVRVGQSDPVVRRIDVQSGKTQVVRFGPFPRGHS